jgi:bifunctional oligoribonuclease and PAP phosphatase NrnA
MSYEISSQIKEKAPFILAEIKKAKSVLLHCHPSPDPDSVGSALECKFAVEQLGKKATVIKGDSEIPEAFMHFPGAGNIVMKSYWEIDPAEYDLFIIVDSDISGVSRTKKVELPPAMIVVNIDHHRTNNGLGQINITDTSYPATGQLLFDIFKEMKVRITPEIAANLFIGMYTDTGGFKYEKTTQATFEVAGELVSIYPSFSRLVADMENSATLEDLAFSAAALSTLDTEFEGKVLLSILPNSIIIEKNIPDVSISAGSISSILRKVGTFDVVGALIESRPNKVKVSFRSKNSDLHDVSKLAASLGGGGHKAAAGVSLDMSLDDAKKLVLAKIKELYNF